MAETRRGEQEAHGQTDGPPRGAGRSHFPAATANAKKRAVIVMVASESSVCAWCACSRQQRWCCAVASQQCHYYTAQALWLPQQHTELPTPRAPGHGLTPAGLYPPTHNTPNPPPPPPPPAGLPKQTRRLPASIQQERERRSVVVKRVHSAPSLRSSEPARPIASSARCIAANESLRSIISGRKLPKYLRTVYGHTEDRR
jgi:hypothetical protein